MLTFNTLQGIGFSQQINDDTEQFSSCGFGLFQGLQLEGWGPRDEHRNLQPWALGCPSEDRAQAVEGMVGVCNPKP